MKKASRIGNLKSQVTANKVAIQSKYGVVKVERMMNAIDTGVFDKETEQVVNELNKSLEDNLNPDVLRCVGSTSSDCQYDALGGVLLESTLGVLSGSGVSVLGMIGNIGVGTSAGSHIAQATKYAGLGSFSTNTIEALDKISQFTDLSHHLNLKYNVGNLGANAVFEFIGDKEKLSSIAGSVNEISSGWLGAFTGTAKLGYEFGNSKTFYRMLVGDAVTDGRYGESYGM